MVEGSPGEIWKDVAGWEIYYKISNKGRLVSKVTGKMKKPIKSRSRDTVNNLQYSLVCSIDGKKYQRVKHAARMMYEAFIGKVPDGYQVGIKINHPCHLENVVIIQAGSVRQLYTNEPTDMGLQIGDLYRGSIIKAIDKYYIEVNTSQRGRVNSPHYMLTCSCSKCGEELKIQYNSAHKQNEVLLCGRCKSLGTRDNFKYQIGDKIGEGVLIIGDKDNKGRYLCKCLKCNKEFRGNVKNIHRLKVSSCGCYTYDQGSTCKDLGIGTKHPLYGVYRRMIGRCYTENPKDRNYGSYANKKVAYNGVGIRVCNYWRDSFRHFVEWALKNGWADGLVIDRIDSRGDYGPWNCQWITIQNNIIKSNTYDVEYKKDPEIAQQREEEYYKKRDEWLKEMEALGYSEEEVL